VNDTRAAAVEVILRRIVDQGATTPAAQLRDLGEALSYVQRQPPPPRSGRVMGAG
jgi:hypothetical protein